MILDSRLEADSCYITNLTLCQVRLHHNAAFPWILLIPQKPDLCEIIDLTTDDQYILVQELAFMSQVMRDLFHPTKLNIAALGNIVPQLHIHVIARYENDAAWPQPVWNSGKTAVYTDSEKQEKLTLLKEALSNHPLPTTSPLEAAHQFLANAAKEGFDWSSPLDAASKVREEFEEVLDALEIPPSQAQKMALIEEIGDLFLACAALSRHCNVLPEDAITVAFKKFKNRFEHLKTSVAEQNTSLKNLSRENILELWALAKQKNDPSKTS